MEIKSEKNSRNERIIYIVIILVCLTFVLAVIRDIVIHFQSGDQKFLLIKLFFIVLFVGTIKITSFGLIADAITYRLDSNGISILYNGKIRRKYQWDGMKTKRIEYKGKGFLDIKTREIWQETNECAIFCIRRIRKSIWQSSFPPEAWNERVSRYCIFFSGLPWIIIVWRVLFQRHDVVRIYLEEKKDICSDDIYYGNVNKEYFIEKMAEWHVELEDNKPEEIPPWKEQL